MAHASRLARMMETPHGKLSIPKTIWRLKIAELPATTRLRSVLTAAGFATLGELHGQHISEVREQRHCGPGTVLAFQQLIARAILGEFDSRYIEPANAPRALLNLIEDAIASLPSRDRHLLLQRFGGQGRRATTLEQLGQRRGVTRERMRARVNKLLDTVRVTFGPRIPRLLKVLSRRCLSNISPLTPQLLKEWAPDFRTRLHLSAQAHVRIIAALDKSVPAWPRGHELFTDVRDDSRDLGVRLATIARDTGGSISVAQAYRRLRTQRGYQSLKVSEFLRLLRTARRIRVRFDNPQSPAIRRFRRLIRRRRASSFHKELGKSQIRHQI